MIHALALPLLLSGAPPVPVTLRAVPEDPVFALHVDGGEELRARLQDNTWLKLAMEAAGQPLSEVLGEFDLPPMDAWLADIDDVSVFLASGDDPLGTMGLFVTTEGGDAIQSAFARLRETIEEEVAPTSDEHGIVLYDVSEMGFDLVGDTDAVELVLVQHGQLFGIVAADESGTAARIVAAALHPDGEQPEGIANAYSELAGAHIGIHFDLGSVVELIGAELSGPDGAMFAKLFEGLGAVGASMKFGEGGAVEGLVHLAYDEDSIAAEFADVFQPFDHGLLGWAPVDVTAINIVGIDWLGFADVLLGLVDEVEPGTSDTAMDALDEFADQTGVHVMDDLVGLLDGSVLTYFTDLPDFEAIEAEELFPGLGYVFGLKDAEAFEENLLAVLEPMGLGEYIEVNEKSHGNFYTVPDFPLELGIGVGRGALAFAMGDAVGHVEEMLSGGDPPSAAENRVLRKALEENEDSVSIAIWDVSMIEAFLEAAEAPFEAGALLDDLEGTFVVTSDVTSTGMTMRAELR